MNFMVMHSNLGCSITKDDKFTKKTNLQWDGFLYSENLNFTVVTMKEELWLCATAGGAEKVKIFFFCIIINSRKNILTLYSFCENLKNWNSRTKNEPWLRTVSHIPVCNTHVAQHLTFPHSNANCLNDIELLSLTVKHIQAKSARTI